MFVKLPCSICVSLPSLVFLLSLAVSRDWKHLQLMSENWIKHERRPCAGASVERVAELTFGRSTLQLLSPLLGSIVTHVWASNCQLLALRVGSLYRVSKIGSC